MVITSRGTRTVASRSERSHRIFRPPAIPESFSWRAQLPRRIRDQENEDGGAFPAGPQRGGVFQIFPATEGSGFQASYGGRNTQFSSCCGNSGKRDPGGERARREDRDAQRDVSLDGRGGRPRRIPVRRNVAYRQERDAGF